MIYSQEEQIMPNQNNQFISQLRLQDFQIILKEFDIELDLDTQQYILTMIQNNQYALIHDQYQFVLEGNIKKLTSQHTCQKLIYLLNHYFKPLLKV